MNDDPPPREPVIDPDRFLAEARLLLPALRPSERKVLLVIVEQPDRIPLESITELAARVSSSESTVVRLCQQLGLKGFGELKLILARRTSSPLQLARGHVRPGDSSQEIIQKTVGETAALITDVATGMDDEALDAFDAAVRALSAADRVLVLGIGASSAIAQDAAHQFRSIGLRVDAPVDGFTQLFEAGRLGPDDVCFAVSHTGATTVILQCVAAAQAAGATGVAVSSYRRTPLSKLVDNLLPAGGRNLPYRAEAAASRLAHLCVVDALCTAVAVSNPERSAAALDLLQRTTTTNQV
ncbi:MurR/RpiR family transcriptional regulator [Streptomyces sp. NPDC093085]|uniref:MurR/RpiR family transcriptional regulator n=1 Tax=Streptomyces sp. NPDC093085 TaxID=3155068 RepID=UPI003419C531